MEYLPANAGNVRLLFNVEAEFPNQRTLQDDNTICTATERCTVRYPMYQDYAIMLVLSTVLCFLPTNSNRKTSHPSSAPHQHDSQSQHPGRYINQWERHSCKRNVDLYQCTPRALHTPPPVAAVFDSRRAWTEISLLVRYVHSTNHLLVRQYRINSTGHCCTR